MGRPKYFGRPIPRQAGRSSRRTWRCRRRRSAWSARRPAPGMLGPCQLTYARFGPGRKLTAYYDALVRVEGTGRYSARPVAVTWGSDGEADRHHGTADLAESRAEAVRRGVAAPFRQRSEERRVGKEW